MKIEDVALSFVPNITATAVAHLIDIFGSAEAVFAASEAELVSRAELRGDIARAIVSKCTFRTAERDIAYCQKQGIEIFSSADDSYPEPLRFVADHPHIIYVAGDSSLIGKRELCALMGERDSITAYGEKVALRMLEQIADSVPEAVVVGAIDGGVDAMALRSARHFGLRSVGVVNGPLCQIAEPSAARLAAEILDGGGALVSELGIMSGVADESQAAHHRIIAALCSGVVVIEAESVPVVAKYADSYGRQVLAVPGRVTDVMSRGTNAMIASSMAQMVCSGRDVIEQFGWE